MRSFAFALIMALTLAPALNLCGQSAVSPDDLTESLRLRKKFKDEAYVALRITEKYTFEKGVNEFKQPVVTVKETGEAEFIGLKDIAIFQYYKFHNRFVKLKSFTRYDKYQNKYILTGKRGFDQSVTDENTFFDDSRVQVYSFRFLEKGKVAKMNWVSEYTDGKYLTRNFFHEPFPVVEKVLEYEVPEWLDIQFVEKNFQGYKVEKTRRPSGKATIYSFKVKEYPALKNEANDLGIAYTHPHILTQIKSFTNGAEKINVFQNTADLYKWYSQLYKMAGNDVSPLKSQVNQITANKKTDEEKIKAIYYWVQDNIRYIAYEDGYAGYIPASTQEVFSVKYGDCKGMANLLTEMLKIAGYDARFTWIGTRHLPYDHSIPVMCVDNHAITALYFKNKVWFLDGTEKYNPLGEDAYRIQGKSALIEKGEAFEEVKVPLSKATDHVIRTVATLQLENNSLKGHVKFTLTGNERKDFHQHYQEMPIYAQQDYLKEILEFGNTNLKASQIKSSDLTNREIPVVIEGDIDLTNNINNIGNDQYVHIDFFPKNLSRYMPDEKRQKGFDFESVFAFEDELELVLPAGKKCIDLPEKLTIDRPGYSFVGSYETTGNKVRLKKTLTIKESVIPADQLADWKVFLESIREFNSYLLTITKS